MTDLSALPVHPSGDTWSEAFGRRHAVAVPALAAVALLTAPWLWSLPVGTVAVAAAALVVAGVPHGAVDHRVARPLLHPSVGRAWFVAFTALYLGAAAAVLVGWAIAPAASLVAFLALSALHFGAEDAGGHGGVAVLARGGAPIALAILWHPERTERFFAVLGGTPDGFVLLHLAAWCWVAPAALHAWRLVRTKGATGEAVELGALTLVFAALPPTMAFAFYFLVVHSPRHMAELALRRDPRDAAAGWGWTLRAAVPLSLATAALGAALFAALEGSFEERLLRTVFWGLAALTVPHMALSALDRRAGRPALR